MKLILLCACLCAGSFAQGLRDSGQRTNPTLSEATAQGFHGTALPGAVAGNLSGDTYLYTPGGAPAVSYFCGAPHGTPAPACTTVAAGQWQPLAAAASSSAQVYYLSQIDLPFVPNCNLSTGLNPAGGACADFSSAIDRVLATATPATPVLLILDGGAGLAGAAVGPAAGHWKIQGQGWATGLFMLAGAGSDAIQNLPGACPFSGNLSPATPGTPGNDIGLANFRVNGNRPNNAVNSDHKTCTGSANWIVGIYLDNMNYVRIDDLWIYDSPTYGLLLDACNDCVVSNSRIDAASQQLNQDGIHVCGPSSYIREVNNWFNTRDDSATFNPLEGYGGNITDVAIANSHCVGCLTAMTIYGNEGAVTGNYVTSGVTFVNGSGTIQDSTGVTGTAFRFGGADYNGTSNPELIRDVHISNSSYQLLSADASMVTIGDNVGEIALSNVSWIAPVGASPWFAFNGGYAGTPSGVVNLSATSLSCTQCRITRNAAGSAAAFWLATTTAVAIKRLEFNGASIENATGTSAGALPYLMDVSAGSIASLVLTSFDPTNGPTLLNGNEWSRVADFYGAGVPAFYRNTTYANLPPASYRGLSVSISDSAAAGIWGATETGGSAGHFAQLNSNGTNWTVTGK